MTFQCLTIHKLPFLFLFTALPVSSKDRHQKWKMHRSVEVVSHFSAHFSVDEGYKIMVELRIKYVSHMISVSTSY